MQAREDARLARTVDPQYVKVLTSLAIVLS
jgi:hypothetical protein